METAMLVVRKKGTDAQGAYTKTVVMYFNPTLSGPEEECYVARHGYPPGGEIPWMDWNEFSKATQMNHPMHYRIVANAMRSAPMQRKKAKLNTISTVQTSTNTENAAFKQITAVVLQELLDQARATA